MKKNILFSVCVMLFVFMTFTGNVSADDDYYTKVCDYNNPLTTFSCTEDQKFYSTAKEAHPDGRSCIIALSDQNSPQNSVTVSGKCPSEIDVIFVSGNTCALYGCEVEKNYNNVVYNTNTITCGDVTGIPENLPIFIRRLINLVKILVPIVLIIMGIIDFLKAMTAGDEKAMSEAPRRFVRRIIVSILIFLVVVIIQFVVRLISDASTKAGSDNPASSIANCISCFVSDGRYCTAE